MKIKLYTQEQVLDAIEKSEIGYSGSQIIESLTPIELPSDEEMDKFLLDNSYEYGYGYRDAINWMKEQILNQNK